MLKDLPKGIELWNSLLPKEVVVAAGQVDLHIDSAYSELPLMAKLRMLSGDDFGTHQGVYTEALFANEPLPGWTITWAL